MKNKPLISPTERLAEIESLVNPLLNEAADIRQKMVESKSAFRVGDIITWDNGRGRVTEIRLWCCEQPMWKVRRIRVDGSLGSECMVRDYMKPALDVVN